jgi:dCTP diphosphatase
LKQLQEKIVAFGQAREWQQFHSPKNLSMALSVESAELLEIFQWLSESQSDSLNEEQRSAAKDELADIAMYCLLLADRLNINLDEAIENKLTKNEQRYPVNKSKGKALKTSEL